MDRLHLTVDPNKQGFRIWVGPQPGEADYDEDDNLLPIHLNNRDRLLTVWLSVKTAEITCITLTGLTQEEFANWLSDGPTAPGIILDVIKQDEDIKEFQRKLRKQ
jgi:hypothetical protein